MVVKMLVIDSENTTKIEQNQEPIIGAAVKARLEQTIFGQHFFRIARVTSAIGEERVIRRAGPRESCITSDEVLRTLLFEVAGLLNSRPLTYTSSDPDDFRPLTPNDFLNRAPVADLPAGVFRQMLPGDHYGYIQRITNLFSDVWRGSFLQSVVSRKKWRMPARYFAVGDFILDDWKTAPRGRWQTGKIVKVYRSGRIGPRC